MWPFHQTICIFVRFATFIYTQKTRWNLFWMFVALLCSFLRVQNVFIDFIWSIFLSIDWTDLISLIVLEFRAIVNILLQDQTFSALNKYIDRHIILWLLCVFLRALIDSVLYIFVWRCYCCHSCERSFSTCFSFLFCVVIYASASTLNCYLLHLQYEHTVVVVM